MIIYVCNVRTLFDGSQRRVKGAKHDFLHKMFACTFDALFVLKAVPARFWTPAFVPMLYVPALVSTDGWRGTVEAPTLNNFEFSTDSMHLHTPSAKLRVLNCICLQGGSRPIVRVWVWVLVGGVG